MFAIDKLFESEYKPVPIFVSNDNADHAVMCQVIMFAYPINDPKPFDMRSTLELYFFTISFSPVTPPVII